MRARVVLLSILSVVGLGAGSALADHFDSNASTGSFNPQMTATITQSLVNRPTGFRLRITQQDHEDPPAVVRLRSPGDWQFAFTKTVQFPVATRQAQTTAGLPTTNCKAAIDNLNNSPNGTGTGTNVDYSKRTDAKFVRAEKIATSFLAVHIDGVTRPGLPATWNGQIAFISYDAVAQTAKLCALFISNDSRVISLPDTNPSDTKDDIEDVTEIVGEFPVARVTDGSGTYWQTLIDLSGLVKSSTFQTLNVSLIELDSVWAARSVGNWHAGGIDFSRAPAVSGVKTFQGVFSTCPANDPAYGKCKSGRPDVVRSFNFTMVLPPVVVTGPPNGSLLNTNPVAVSGTGADAGASVQIFEGSEAIGAPATADAAGNWTASVPVSDGAHTVFAKTVDAGGASPESNTRSFTIDTTPPAIPLIAQPSEGVLIGGTTVTFSGSAEVGARVDVSLDALPLGTTAAGPSGSWSLTATVSKGSHIAHATATDIAGNTSALSAPRSFDVTTARPVIAAPVQNGATNQATVTFTGTSEPGATLTLDEGGSLVGAAVLAGPDGSWSVGASLPEGEHMVTATAVKDGFTSAPTPVRTFTVDFTAPAAPVIISPVTDDVIGTISVPVSGTGEPGAAIAIFEASLRVGAAGVDAAGNWAAIAVLSDGEHTIRAVATDRAGNAGPASAEVTFIVDDPLEILSPAAGSVNPGTFTITGSADVASTQVRVYEGFFEIGRSPVVDGAWTMVVTMPTGLHTIRARSVTGDVLGPVGAPHTFRVDATPPVVKIKKPSGYLLFGRLIGDPLRGYVTDSGPADSLVDRIEVTYTNVFTGDKTTRAIVCGACPAASVEWSDVPPVLPGFYRVTAKAYDRVGNSSSVSLLFLIL